MELTDWFYWSAVPLLVVGFVSAFAFPKEANLQWSRGIMATGMALVGASVATLPTWKWYDPIFLFAVAVLVGWDVGAMISHHKERNNNARDEVRQGQEHGVAPEEAGDGA